MKIKRSKLDIEDEVSIDSKKILITFDKNRIWQQLADIISAARHQKLPIIKRIQKPNLSSPYVSALHDYNKMLDSTYPETYDFEPKKDLIESIYPIETTKNKTSRKIILLLIKKELTTIQIFKCMYPTLVKKNFILTKKQKSEINNCIRYLNSDKLKQLGYIISRQDNIYKLLKR